MQGPARLRSAIRSLVAATIVLALGAASASAIPGVAGGPRGHGVGHHRAYAKTLSPTNGETVSGRIEWRVAIRGARAKRVEFAVDGAVKTHQGPRTRTATIDTTALSNGPHTLTAIAYGSHHRRLGKSRVKVTVENSSAVLANGPSSIYWGATIGTQLTGTQAPWDMNAVSKFEGMAGKPLSLVHFYSPFANCSSSPCSFYNFPTSVMENIRQHGAIPFLSWASQSIPGSLNEPNFRLSAVINGTYDSYIRSFASAAASWGHPFFLRFNYEMNGNWFPWSESVNGNGPGQFVSAWRHVHDIFTSVGATNATWVWCPNVDPYHAMQGLSSVYPGDAYVDWSCLDGYNWGTNPAAPKGWMSFDQLYSSTYHQIVDSIAPTKPMVIGEFGSSEYGGSKAAWIQDALSKIPTEYPKVRALQWYETYADGMDWPIETSASATAAFASGIQSPAYTQNTYSNLNTSPIPAPG